MNSSNLSNFLDSTVYVNSDLVCFVCFRKQITKLADHHHLQIIIGNLVSLLHLIVSSIVIMQSIVIRSEYIMFYCHLCFEKGKEVDEVCCKM